MKKKMLLAGILVLLLSFGCVYADAVKDAVFNDLIDSLREDGVIPRTRGTVTCFGNYSEDYKNMGMARWFILKESPNFVLNAKVHWLNANETPNGRVAGCGVVFASATGTENHLMFSIRMDGHAYFTGRNAYKNLSYGKYYYGNPWWEGEAEITVVVSGTNATFYMNGQRMFFQPEIPVPGTGIGLAVLSGTNYGFGTRCSWEDIYLFTWE